MTSPLGIFMIKMTKPFAIFDQARLCDVLLNRSEWYVEKDKEWIPACAAERPSYWTNILGGKHPSHGKKVLGGMTEGGGKDGAQHARRPPA